MLACFIVADGRLPEAGGQEGRVRLVGPLLGAGLLLLRFEEEFSDRPRVLLRGDRFELRA